MIIFVLLLIMICFTKLSLKMVNIDSKPIFLIDPNPKRNFKD